jgi:3-hydroxybutyryl-CoA dehydratase
MSHSLAFEDLHVGQRWESRSRTITESDVVNFAGLTGDFDPLHVDHEYARNTPFGKPIAHGLLGLSLVAGLGSTYPAVHTIAFVEVREWKFLRPAFFGDTVRVLNEVVEKRSRGRRTGEITWRRRLINQNGAIVQEGLFVTLVALAATLSDTRDEKHPDADTPRAKAV